MLLFHALCMQQYWKYYMDSQHGCWETSAFYVGIMLSCLNRRSEISQFPCGYEHCACSCIVITLCYLKPMWSSVLWNHSIKSANLTFNYTEKHSIHSFMFNSYFIPKAMVRVCEVETHSAWEGTQYVLLLKMWYFISSSFPKSGS